MLQAGLCSPPTDGRQKMIAHVEQNASEPRIAPPRALRRSSHSPARVAQLDRIARGKQAGARAPGHLGGSASGGAAAHLWPALRARARQRRRAGRPGASLRPSGDVGRQGADDNELRASSKAHMLLYAGGAAAACPHQPRLGHNLSGVRGLLRALKSALLLAGAMICAQTMAIKQMLRKFPVNSRLKKTARSLRVPLRDGRAHL